MCNWCTKPNLLAMVMSRVTFKVARPVVRNSRMRSRKKESLGNAVSKLYERKRGMFVDTEEVALCVIIVL